MIRHPALRLAAKLAASLASAALVASLGACVTLFPKETPAPLYRFGDDVPAAAAGGSTLGVRLTGISFDQAAAGDQIMTVTGDQVAYISGGRWAAPAPAMFASAVRMGFDGGSVRLLQAGEAGQSPFVLRLDVARFEARYDHGATGAPTILVRVHATLVRSTDQAQVGAKDFEASVQAGDNRIGAIAEAFDGATNEVVTGLATWVAQTAGG